jgi:hypothetical protein
VTSVHDGDVDHTAPLTKAGVDSLSGAYNNTLIKGCGGGLAEQYDSSVQIKRAGCGTKCLSMHVPLVGLLKEGSGE